MSAPTGGPSLSQSPKLVSNSNDPSNQQPPTLFPTSAKPQLPPPQRRQLDDPSDSFITRIVQTVTLVHYIDGDGNPRGMSTFYATPQTVLADPVTGDVIGPVDDNPPMAADNAGDTNAAPPGEGPGDTNRDSPNSPENLEDSPAAAEPAAAAAAANANFVNANPLQAADDPAPVGQDPGAANRDPPNDAVVEVAPPPGNAVVPEAAPAPGVPEAPQPPGAPETAEPASPPQAEADGDRSPPPAAPAAPGPEQQPEATAPPSPAPPTGTDSENTNLPAATGISEDQTRLSSALASNLSDISSSTDHSSSLSSSTSTQSTSSASTNSAEAESANSDDDGGTNTGAIVGGVVGGVVGLALLLLLMFLLLRRRKKRAGQMRLGDPDGAGAGATAGAAVTDRALPAGGDDHGNNGGGAAGEMAEQSPSSPSSTGGGVLAAMATLNRSRSSPSGSQRSTERGFYRVSGKKLPSVIHHGGDGYSDPRRHSTISGASSGNTDSHGLEVEPGEAPKLALGQPMRPVSGVPVIRSSPARTPIEVEEGNPFSNPFDDPPPGLNPDGVGRSLGAQDMSRGSRGSSSKFMEDL